MNADCQEIAVRTPRSATNRDHYAGRASTHPSLGLVRETVLAGRIRGGSARTLRRHDTDRTGRRAWVSCCELGIASAPVGAVAEANSRRSDVWLRRTFDVDEPRANTHRRQPQRRAVTLGDRTHRRPAAVGRDPKQHRGACRSTTTCASWTSCSAARPVVGTAAVNGSFRLEGDDYLLRNGASCHSPTTDAYRV